MCGAAKNKVAVLACAIFLFIGAELSSPLVVAGTASTAKSELDPKERDTIGKLSEQFIHEFIGLPIAFTKKTEAVATVFIRNSSGNDFVRVSTSLPKQDNTFAFETTLGKSHPGYKQLLEGKMYQGKATLFGKSYITQYSPINDPDGKTIAILFVGIVKK